jgi:hypothetical protein
MRWLRSMLDDEDGVTAVILAVILIPLIGIVALVLDVGFMRWEVRQLQNGADAAALAIAQACADGLDCRDMADAMALDLTRANANDGSAEAVVEFDTVGPNTVTVTASTRDLSGDARLPYLFAPALGIDEGSFERAATAVWGPMALDGLSLPITISECEWVNATGNGTQLPSPPYVFEIKANPGVNECTMPNSPGHYSPGGWGWLDPTGTGCQAIITPTDVPGNTGSGPPSPDCNANSFNYPSLLGQTFLIPIHNRVNGPGGNPTSYDMLGYGAFTITSYKLSGGIEGGPDACPGNGNNQRCLIGYFQELVPIEGSVDPDLPDLGVRTVQLIG